VSQHKSYLRVLLAYHKGEKEGKDERKYHLVDMHFRASAFWDIRRSFHCRIQCNLESTDRRAVPLGILCDHIVDVGETFTVNFTVANVESSRRMYTWEIYVRFDPKILNVSSRALVWLPSDHVFANKKIVEVEAVLGN
jgi:hypothetical protein